MKTEKEGRLLFLDVMVTRKPNETLAHTVYRKPTHTDRYLNSGCNYHPSQKKRGDQNPIGAGKKDLRTMSVRKGA